MTKFFLIFIITIFSNSILSQLPYYLPSDGLVGWWPFNGNANDESGNGNDGIIVNSMLCQDRFGNESAAFDFNSTDGEEKYIRCLNNETFIFNTYTISVWFRVSEDFDPNKQGINSFGGGIIQKGCDYDFCGSTYRIYVHSPWGLVADNWVNDDCFSRVYVDTTIYSSQYSWNHVVSTYDGESNKLYVNGILSNELPQFGYLTQNQNDIIFGGWFNYTGEECEFTKSFSGKIDDIGIWDRCLSDEEINKLYVTTNQTTLSLTSEFESNRISIYPNPTTDIININLDNLSKFEGGKVKIMSMSGQIVYEENITQSKITLSVADRFSKGIYIVTTTDSDGNILSNEKLVVQ